MFLLFSIVVSCEDDFTDINVVVSNTKFSTGELVLDLEINTINTENIIADNIGLPFLPNSTQKLQADYWLGVYNNKNAKKLEAGFVSQLTPLPANLKTKRVLDTIYNLDKVILKFPYTAISLGTDTNGVTNFRLDSILGNPSIATSVKVYRNPTYLNETNPKDLTKKNTFASNFDYQETDLLSEATGFSFKPRAIDTVFIFNRIDRRLDINSITTIKDSLRVKNKSNISIPFLAIPLDLSKMKTLFWDKFYDTEFSSSKEFQTYFRGVVLKATGDDGALIPLKLSGASIDFLYSKTVVKKDEANEISKAQYSFFLGGIQSSIYTMGVEPSLPANNFVVQGIAGFSAEIKVLGVNLLNLRKDTPNNPFLLAYENKDIDNNNYLDLKELASIKDVDNNEFGFLINDADLTFYVNNVLSSNAIILPQKLYVYQNKDNGNDEIDGVIPTHLSDSYEESTSYNGVLYTNKEMPENYTFKITDYISDLLDGSSTDFSPLGLKVFNTTDSPLISNNRLITEKVPQYNWNPRSVVLFNENGTKKAQLKLTYTQKRN